MKREPYIHCQLKKNKTQSSRSVGVLLFLRSLEILQTDDVQVARLHQMTDFTVGETPLRGQLASTLMS